MRLESHLAILETPVFDSSMNYDRSKRLEKILESANQFEASQSRRKRVSLIMWGFLVVLILIGMFFAGRVWYSRSELPAGSDSLRSAPTQAAEVSLPDPESTALP